MANKYAVVGGRAGQISQDPAEIDINVTVDAGATAVPLGASAATGGTTTTPMFGVAGVNAILVIGTYVDDADSTIGSVSRFWPGHGTNTAYANEKLTALDMGGILPGGEVASGTLTIAEPVTNLDTYTVDTTVYTLKTIIVDVAAQGTLTIAEPVTNADTFTIGATVYRTMTTPAQAFDVAIGANEAATKVNIVAAINASGTPGVEYFAGTLAHPTVSAAVFVGDNAVITARVAGTAGAAIATTETFTHASNIFDAGTLGTTTARADADVAAQGTLTIAEPVTDEDTFTIGTRVYQMKTTPAAAYDVAIGENEAATKVNIVAAINASGTPGTEYFAGTLAHPTVSAIAFSGDDCVLSADATGLAGNSIATTETFTHASNVFDDETLGTTTAGDIVVAYDVAIGADEAASKVNIVAAINASGTEGVEYFAGTNEHPTVSAVAFVGDDCVLTAKFGGLAGDAIATTETFTHGSNIFDGVTLGAVTAGIDFEDRTSLEPIGISADVAVVDQNA